MAANDERLSGLHEALLPDCDSFSPSLYALWGAYRGWEHRSVLSAYGIPSSQRLSRGE